MPDEPLHFLSERLLLEATNLIYLATPNFTPEMARKAIRVRHEILEAMGLDYQQ